MALFIQKKYLKVPHRNKQTTAEKETNNSRKRVTTYLDVW